MRALCNTFECRLTYSMLQGFPWQKFGNLLLCLDDLFTSLRIPSFGGMQSQSIQRISRLLWIAFVNVSIMYCRFSPLETGVARNFNINLRNWLFFSPLEHVDHSLQKDKQRSLPSHLSDDPVYSAAGPCGPPFCRQEVQHCLLMGPFWRIVCPQLQYPWNKPPCVYSSLGKPRPLGLRLVEPTPRRAGSE